MGDKLLTLTEIAEKLRVSKFTIQAWMSPSSPNHKPEFASIARHAGRKTVFLEDEVETWLNQRKGSLYSQSISETSAYWRERFFAARGLFKNFIKAPIIDKLPRKGFNNGKLGLDFEPLLVWLSDSHYSIEIASTINKSDGLVVAVPLVWWFLRKFWRNKKHFELAKKFFIEDNIFELSPMNENSLQRSLELPQQAGELSIQSYSCNNVYGASSLLTFNQVLLNTKGLAVCSI